MARPGLTKHRKFLRLSRALGSRPLAYGVLGLLWESAYEAGEKVVGDAEDVEAICDWAGRPGALTAALQECGGAGPGFLVEGDGGRLEIHDFWTHAPSYVRKRAERETEREKRGQTLSDIRAAAGRRGAAATNSKRSANGRPFAGTSAEPSENTSAGNNSWQSANEWPFAATPSTQHPNTNRPAGFAAPHGQEKAAAAVEVQPDKIQISKTAAAVSPSAAVVGLKGRLQLTKEHREFLEAWNEMRRERKMSVERLTAPMLPKLDAVWDAAEAQFPESALPAIGLLMSRFLDAKMPPEGDGTNLRGLNTLLNPEVWRARLDTACATLHRREADERSRRRL